MVANKTVLSFALPSPLPSLRPSVFDFSSLPSFLLPPLGPQPGARLLAKICSFTLPAAESVYLPESFSSPGRGFSGDGVQKIATSDHFVR